MEPIPGRRLPVGAEVGEGAGVHFRVWAPVRRRVEVLLEGGAGAGGHCSLRAEGNGYFSGSVADAGAGTLYRYRLDGADGPFPDPASRFQPDGPHGASQVVDPGAFRWTDTDWRGVRLEGQVLYEMHVGTFTRAGSWAAAAAELPELAHAGITVVEVMPVADFPGRFGWGYDGVDLFAPTRLYGRPDDFRAFVDRAHALGLAVILDVVYNHFGPDGCYLRAFSPSYFSDRYENEWGEPLNFDGDASGPVREFFAANAGYWIDEFHLDGLRLDATQQMFDSSPEHIVAEVTRAVRRAAGERETLVVCENEPQDVRLVKPVEEGGHGADAVWNDDFHHASRVALTGHNEAYLSDYLGSPQELVSAAKRGYLYQGQESRWQGKRRGTPTAGVAPAAFVTYLQNHDQLANSATGARLHRLTSEGRYRAMTAFLLLAPGTPMLFQGQEFAASSPFLYFADHGAELAEAVRKGRQEFLSQFPSIASPEVRARLADPGDLETFHRSRLVLSERVAHPEAYALHRDLIRLRREEPFPGSAGAGELDGAVLGPEALALRFFGGRGDDRLLLMNLGPDLAPAATPEPLLAAPPGKRWELLWSSESPRYGGGGTPPLATEDGWRLPGECALVLAPHPTRSTRAEERHA
jgi:maltooligosyltrehalose trehalohydrolase